MDRLEGGTGPAMRVTVPTTYPVPWSVPMWQARRGPLAWDSMSGSRPTILIAGGGVAGLEALLVLVASSASASGS